MAREMKNSGLPWVGKIPSDWEIKRLKYAADYFYKGNGITKDEVFEDGDISCIRYGEIYSKYNGAFVNCISKTKLMVQESPRHIKKGDILFACTGELVEEIGKNIVYMGDNPCLVGGDIIVMRHQQDPIFMNYALNSYAQTQKSEGKAKLKVVHISSKDIQNLMVLLPTLPEQKAIADFLDGKCADIDGLLADLEAEVKTLSEYKKSIISEVTTQGLNQNVKMKQSGIDWVGNIPAHWQVVPFRSYVVERAEKNLGGRNKNLLALSFALGVTRYADKKYNMDRVKEDFSGYQIVHEKDLVLSPNDIIKGSIFVSEYKGCISPMYRVFSNYDPETYNLYYLSYHLRTKESGRKFFYIARGLIGEILDNGKYVTRRMSVSQQDLLKFKVLLPPIEEQNEIVRYLDEKCASIEQSIADKQTQIETLKSYKASLIYEYVTGKKQVI